MNIFSIKFSLLHHYNPIIVVWKPMSVFACIMSLTTASSHITYLISINPFEIYTANAIVVLYLWKFNIYWFEQDSLFLRFFLPHPKLEMSIRFSEQILVFTINQWQWSRSPTLLQPLHDPVPGLGKRLSSDGLGLDEEMMISTLYGLKGLVVTARHLVKFLLTN